MTKIKIPVHVEQVDLTKIYSDIPEERVCRTCVHDANHLWHLKSFEKIERVKAGEKLVDMKCAPDKDFKSVRVLETTTSRGRIVSLNANSAKRTRAIVDTCGQSIRKVCLGCDRFEPVQTRVPYSRDPNVKIIWTEEERNGEVVGVPVTSDGSAVMWWNVTIGGSCTIPVDGMVKDGKRVFCDPTPRKLKIDNPSCANCHWLDYAGEQWQTDYLTINDNAALTPWEREEAKAYVNEDTNYAMAIGLRLRMKQTQPWGRSYFFRARVLREGWHRGMYKYRVQFDENHVTGVLVEDYRFTVHRLDEPDMVAVEILMPHHRMFGLDDQLFRKPLRWPKPAKATYDEPDLKHLVDVNCPRCIFGDLVRWKPCYHHAKGPVLNDATGEIEYTNPEGFKPTWTLPPHGLLHVTMRNGEIVALDGNDNLPVTYNSTDEPDVANAGTFRAQLTMLHAQAYKLYGPEGIEAIDAQFKKLTSKLRRAYRAIPVRPNWYANGGTEPAKPRCTHPAGLNLRRVFADSFGSERTDWNYDNGSANVMAVEEELRVGYRQHHLTPQRLHEEIMSSDAAHPNFDPASNSVVPVNIKLPSQWTRIELRGIGGMTDLDGSPVEDVKRFMDLLDEEVVIGRSGEADRTMTKRMQMFGYDLSRGYYGKRSGADKTSVPSRDRDVVIFGDTEDDQAQVNTDWRCVDCEASYTQDQITDYFYPVCEACGSDLYKLHNARETSNPRQGGGVGNALIADSEAMRQRQRLSSTLCENWALKGSINIVLEDTAGPSRKALTEAQRKLEYTEPDPVEVIKIKQLGLTPEQHKHNAAYWALNEAVIEQRMAYLDEFPQTTNAELAERFPRPKGSIYQPMAAGSLAKMGSV